MVWCASSIPAVGIRRWSGFEGIRPGLPGTWNETKKMTREAGEPASQEALRPVDMDRLDFFGVGRPTRLCIFLGIGQGPRKVA